MRTRCSFAIAFVSLSVLVSCRGTGQVVPAQAVASLALIDTLRLATPAAGICRDGDGVVVFEGTGDRLVRLSAGLAPEETIPVSERLTPAKGVQSDRFYYYVWDDKTIYRMSKEKLVLLPWLGNVRVAGMASYAPGEMLVSDAERGVVWYKTVFGESRRFMDAADLSRPGALAALPDGEFCAITGRGRLAFFNRSAIVVRTMPLPEADNLVAADESGKLYLLERGRPVLRVIRNGRTSSYELAGTTSPSGMTLLEDRLVILDTDTRLVTYALP
jgi:hypothetical protein